ncbi:putative multi-drug efflux transporter [Planotetraspora thailandica]|uniref:Putative multi-drug efflux transporter n=1 Tax=Planotetraspora thailandica TaxID=487172 RepID=A0A8J3XYX5_9ACTN|nr:MFS transporter [Planotetraspora thailandica]GII57996.1 putative multi-drug efflux transporter [Planotetraspora thailandica]
MPALSPADRKVAPGVASPSRSGRRAAHRTAFWFAAGAFAVQMGFGTGPTPLWPLYAARDGFGPTTVTVAFGLLVVGTAVSFLGLGHLSDVHGRRRVIVSALTVAIAASVVLIAWPHLAGLIVGRILTGVGIGLMASTATTYIADLYGAAHPDRHASGVPGIVAAAANLGGLALGPLVAGVIAEWAPQPLISTQAAFGVVMAVFLVLVLLSPETVDSGSRTRVRPARFALLPGGRRTFAGASGIAFFAFAALGLFSSLGSIMIRGRLGIDSPLVAGVAGFVTFGAAAAGQLAMGGARPRHLLAVGLPIFPIGLGLVALSLSHPSLWLYLVASAAAGAGAGLLFKSSVGQAASVAAPASRAGVLAVFFVIAYFGMGVPVILLSVAAESLGLQAAITGFAVLLSAGAAVSAATLRRR